MLIHTSAKDFNSFGFIESAVQVIGYRAGQPLVGIWAGLAKCLPRELPNLAVKVVDVQDTAPEAVAATVLSG